MLFLSTVGFCMETVEGHPYPLRAHEAKIRAAASSKVRGKVLFFITNMFGLKRLNLPYIMQI